MQGVLIELGGYARADSSGLRDWADREQAAADIRIYEMRVIPGLFQTEDYARTLIETTTPWATDIEEQIQIRLSRQAVLQRAEVRAVIEQSAIERVIGDPEIQLDQLARLLTLPKNVHVQVLATVAGHHAGLAGPLAILDFDGGRSLVGTESRYPSEIAHDPREVRRAERAYNALVAAAMSEEQSTDYIAAIIEELQ